jgi:hypothetical protein
MLVGMLVVVAGLLGPMCLSKIAEPVRHLHCLEAYFSMCQSHTFPPRYADASSYRSQRASRYRKNLNQCQFQGCKAYLFIGKTWFIVA